MFANIQNIKYIGLSNTTNILNNISKPDSVDNLKLKIANLKKNAKKRNPWGQVALQQ